MPYKDPEAKRRYMSRYYEQNIKTGAIPSTAFRKRFYGLTSPCANKTQTFTSPVLAPKAGVSQPISPLQTLPHLCNPSLIRSLSLRESPGARGRGGAEYKERIPKGFTSLGNGVAMRFIKPGET
jgi:hypothetical protein